MATNNQLNVGLSGSTGSGNFVGANTPTLITPVLGAATATSLTFGGSTLSTYQTGTWTPVFTSSGGGTATYTTQQGLYTHIGNLVFFDLFITLSALPSDGFVTITGLPLPVAGVIYACSTYASALQATVTSPLTALAVNGGSAITLYSFATGASTQLTVAQCTTTSSFIISGFYNP